MINELFDMRFGIQSKIVYINDKIVPNNFINDFISKIEMDSCLYQPYIDMIMLAEEKLFRFVIKKTIQELTPEDTVRIIIEDKDHNIIDRRFNFVSARDVGGNQMQGNAYYLVFRDVYGYVLTNIEFTRYITAHGYSGLPIKIIHIALIEALTPVVEINKSRKEKTIGLNTKIFQSKIPLDAPIDERFVMDKTIQQNLTELANMYNIKIFQDWNNINVWQNVSVDQLELLNDKDNTEIYSDECSSLYANKICDYVKMPSNSNMLSRVNFRAYKSVDGIHHETQTLDFDDFLPMITMNNNSNSFRDIRQAMTTSSSSKLDTLENLVRKSFDTYINNNTIIIYVRPFFKNVSVGTKVTVRIHNNTEFIADQAEGDLEYNGTWLVVQSTICNIGQHLICRLTLKRCDNMIRSDASRTERSAEENNGVDYSINRPEVSQTSELSNASRSNLDDDLQKDIERRLSRTDQPSDTWKKASDIKTVKALRRVKDVESVTDRAKSSMETYLSSKRDALLQLKRAAMGINDVVNTVKDVKRFANDVINTVEDAKQFANGVVNEVKQLKEFYSLKNIKSRLKNYAALQEAELISYLNKEMGTDITVGDVDNMIRNKNFKPTIERELSNFSSKNIKK